MQMRRRRGRRRRRCNPPAADIFPLALPPARWRAPPSERALFLALPGQVDEALYAVIARVGDLTQGEHRMVILPGVRAGVLTGLVAGPGTLGIGQLQLAGFDGVGARHLQLLTLVHLKLPLAIETHGVGCSLRLVRAG